MEKQSQRKSGSYFNNVSLAAMSVCRKNMRKLRQKIIIGFSICIVGFAGTKPLYAAERVAEKPLELSIWYPWTDKYDAYQRTFLETIEEYNKMHTDVHLIAKGMEMEFYREKITTDIASNDVPDIYFCYSDEYMRNIAASGRILNMDPYLKSDMYEKREEFHDSMLYNGERYALGFAESVGVFFVNTDLLQQYQCEIPTDWEDAFQICQIFTDQGRIPFVCSDDSDIFHPVVETALNTSFPLASFIRFPSSSRTYSRFCFFRYVRFLQIREGFHLSVQMIQILDFVCIWKSSVWTRPEQKSPYQ